MLFLGRRQLRRGPFSYFLTKMTCFSIRALTMYLPLTRKPFQIHLQYPTTTYLTYCFTFPVTFSKTSYFGSKRILHPAILTYAQQTHILPFPDLCERKIVHSPNDHTSLRHAFHGVDRNSLSLSTVFGCIYNLIYHGERNFLSQAVRTRFLVQ